METKFGVFLISALLAGCSTVSSRNPAPTDPAQVKLAEAAVSVSNSLQQLAEVEEAANPQAKIRTPPNPSSYDMGKLASLDWSGPIEPLVARLASASGYHMRVLGVAPAIPIIVTIAAKNTPIGDILRNAGFQADDRADILVFPSTRTVELRYSKP